MSSCPERQAARDLCRKRGCRRGYQPPSSARNRLAGVVVKVQRDGVMAQIDLACGPFRIVSLMSREAADELDLKPGQAATAVMESTTVVRRAQLKRRRGPSAPNAAP